ncbi:DUF268 domain-containing protein [Eisenibacter elegans]|jgi:SAM-dependent methyltransferase|uniref:DUF268 domain-containing protein n=1 Tax=Eisenibacter elegans TaxID=997 RepID=UPI0003FB7AF1|nr:DUF268 domain-containing protein [Eisenibacter elegans]
MIEKLKNILRVLLRLPVAAEMLKAYDKMLLQQQQEIPLYESFYADLEQFNSMASPEQKASKEWLYPCIYDKTDTTGIDPTYFYQDAWAFERIVHNKPTEHVDIGSHHKFVAHLSKVLPLTMVDIRPLSLPMESIKFIKGSILDLPFESNSLSSISSLCVVEHIGLGRYGDPIDPQGPQKALAEILRVLKPGGVFYLSVPVSNKYITRFNAGVIFELESFKKELTQNYHINDLKFIVGNTFGNEFAPNDYFATTGLFELIKN